MVPFTKVGKRAKAHLDEEVPKSEQAVGSGPEGGLSEVKTGEKIRFP